MTDSTVCDAAMGTDKIRYLVSTYGRWRWCPTKKMRAHGFQLVNFGAVLTADDKSRAIRLNDEWDNIRRGVTAAPSPIYPRGSIGEGYERAIAIRAEGRKSKGIVWTTEQESRDDWPRAWRWIKQAFADCDPRTVQPEDLIKLRTKVAERVSDSE